jgi:hypothetical protein
MATFVMPAKAGIQGLKYFIFLDASFRWHDTPLLFKDVFYNSSIFLIKSNIGKDLKCACPVVNAKQFL